MNSPHGSVIRRESFSKSSQKINSQSKFELYSGAAGQKRMVATDHLREPGPPDVRNGG
jgi:hypothetical protein